MHAANSTGKEPDTARYADDLARFMQSMGLVIGNHVANRWLSESDARSGVQDCCRILEPVLEWLDEIMVRLRGETIDAAGVVLTQQQDGIRSLVRQMQAHDIKAFSIEKGITLDELVNLLELLGALPDQVQQLGGFAAFATRVGLTHFHVKNVTFREVTDEDVVVKKDAIGTAVAVPSSPGVKTQIVAFLRGEAEAGEPAAAPEAFAQAHSASEEMADLILEAARSGDPAAGDSVSAERVRTILKRAFDFWMQSPDAKTQKGKKEIGKSLRQLESAIVDRLRQAPGFDAGVSELLEDAFGSMEDELTMDVLAAEYARKRKAIEKSETRILRYMRNQGREKLEQGDLAEKLLDGGLGNGDWRELLVKSGVVGEALHGSESAVGAIRDLSARLANIEMALKERGSGKADSGELTQALKVAAVDVDVMVEDTNRKIQSMVEDYHSDAGGAGGGDARQERKRVYRKLSEIAQELCQPLSVIHCSISMITSGRLGDVPPGHADMLKLAVESSHKLKYIADSLMDITGLPEELEPDAAIQAEIYEGQQVRQGDV